jgi:hypothetical protein
MQTGTAMPGHLKALLVVLAGLSGLALSPPAWTQGTSDPVVAPAPRTINLTQEQRFIIKEIVFKDLNIPKARADAPEKIGDAVPQNIVLHPMPPVLAEKVPQGRSHSFFVKEDNAIVLVSPNDRRVADVIR